MPGLRTQSQTSVIHPNADGIALILERLAWLMDRAIPIPGTKLRVGVDAILGLVQTGLVLTAVAHYRVPKAVAVRMVANVLLDLAVGAVPVVGDLFDAGCKANTRNLALLGEVRQRQSLGEPMPSAPSIRYLITIGVVLIGAILLTFVGLVALAAWIVKLVMTSPAPHML